MMKVVSLTLALVLVLATHVADADEEADVLSCFTSMTTSVTCDAVKEATKCAIKKLHFNAPGLATDANINILRNSINSGLSKLGLSCDIDYKRLVNEINSGPTTADHEISACILTAVASGAYISPTCDAVRNVSVCVFKEAGITNATLGTNSSLNAIKDINSAQSQFGLSCQTDFRSVAVEVEREQGSKTPTKYDDATTVEGCFAVLKSQAFAVCDDAEVYTKCAIRVNKANKLKVDLPLVFYQIATKSLATVFNHNAQTCNLDAKSVVQAAIKDLNSGAVSIYGSIHLFTLTVVTTLSFLVLH